MDDAVFIAMLEEQYLFTCDLRERVMAKTTRRERALYFLENTIERSLNINIFEPLHKLLTVMTDKTRFKYSPLEKLATEIVQQLNKETSLMMETVKG